MKSKFTIAATGIIIAMSCTDLEFNNPDDPNSKNYNPGGGESSSSVTDIGSSSSVLGSSSSIPASSSSLASSSSAEEGTLYYEGKTYRTTLIGEQTWLTENLNYNVPGSKCYSGSEANCNKYGRLYDWATAMNLHFSCNTSGCEMGENHQGICPPGWHIPEYSEFQTLRNYVQAENNCTACAGKYLKAKTDWNAGNAGVDTYGFSVLPSGYINSNGSLFQGQQSLMWSATQYSSSPAENAILMRMRYNADSVAFLYEVKTEYYGIRCLKNTQSSGNPSSSSTPPSSSSPAATCGGSPYNPSIQYCSNGVVRDYGSVADDGGKAYKTVAIGEQTWMAENLSYNAIGSKCYGDNDANCNKYGRLYDWTTATTLNVCPSNWQLPSGEDIKKLRNYVENQKSCSLCAGKHLKAKTDWNSNGNGEDTYGFAALPGGYYGDDSFYQIGQYGRYWLEEEHDDENANLWRVDYNGDSLSTFFAKKTRFYTIRCLKNTGTNTPSSSSIAPSSSSAKSSSSSVEYTGGSCNIADYGSVTIGTQVWMAKNYGCYTPGSRCYDNDPANCATYGRLYNWAMAMNLPADCNSSSCATQITAKHKGICPTGWHIPSDEEWGILMQKANPSCSLTGDCANAGNLLKATSGWKDGGNGTNNLGFKALPGGLYYEDDEDYEFGDKEESAFWWTASYENWNGAYYRSIYYNSNTAYHDYANKGNNFISLRCISDNASQPPGDITEDNVECVLCQMSGGTNCGACQ